MDGHNTNQASVKSVELIPVKDARKSLFGRVNDMRVPNYAQIVDELTQVV